MDVELTRTDAVPMTFEAFFEQENAQLYRALCLMTRDRHEAEEIAQDAFLVLWERWDRVGTRIEDPTGYLYRSAMNAFRQRIRRAKVAAQRTLHISETDDIAELESNDAVFRALGSLTRKQRAAVVLVDLLGYSPTEAAGLVGERPGTIRALLHRARTTLRNEVTHGSID